MTTTATKTRTRSTTKANHPKTKATPKPVERDDNVDGKRTERVRGASKPQAVADDIDLSSAIDGTALKPQPRRSKWVSLLDKLYDATVEGKVPRSEDGSLQYIRLGSFTNVNGARTQARALESKGLDATYEFKTVTKGTDGSELWGRVIEVDA